MGRPRAGMGRPRGKGLVSVTKEVAALVGIAATLAAVIYLGQQIRKLAKVITFWSGLPKAHEKLERATKQNTTAIQSMDDALAELSVQVMHLAQVERARGSS